MAKAQVEGAAKKGPTKKVASEKKGVDHARNLEAAIAFYAAEYPDEYDSERNVPFAGHIETVVARLQNK